MKRSTPVQILQKFRQSHSHVQFYLPKQTKKAFAAKAKTDPAFKSMSAFLSAQVELYLQLGQVTVLSGINSKSTQRGE